MPKCQYWPSEKSICLQQPTALVFTTRGPLWLCVESHVGEQVARDKGLEVSYV